MELMRYEPFWMTGERGLLRRFFDDTWLEPLLDIEVPKEAAFLPAVDIRETEDKYLLEVELAGIKKEDVHIDVKDGCLTIRGERKFEHEEKKDTYSRIERTYGSFERNFSLPEHVADDRIEAAYKDGVLTITLPKTEKAKPKEIDVKIQ